MCWTKMMENPRIIFFEKNAKKQKKLDPRTNWQAVLLNGGRVSRSPVAGLLGGRTSRMLAPALRWGGALSL